LVKITREKQLKHENHQVRSYGFGCLLFGLKGRNVKEIDSGLEPLFAMLFAFSHPPIFPYLFHFLATMATGFDTFPGW